MWGQTVIAVERVKTNQRSFPVFPGEAGHGPVTLEHKRFCYAEQRVHTQNFASCALLSGELGGHLSPCKKRVTLHHKMSVLDSGKNMGSLKCTPSVTQRAHTHSCARAHTHIHAHLLLSQMWDFAPLCLCFSVSVLPPPPAPCWIQMNPLSCFNQNLNSTLRSP